MTKTLLFHIGHGKTASSFFQSSFALSTESLLSNGISYPDMTNSFVAARKGRITSGNLHVDKKPLPDYVREATSMASTNAILFSNEMLFPYLIKEQGIAQLQRLVNDGYCLRLLCFARDPLDHAVSLYQQMVKRSGYTGELVDYLENYDTPNQVGFFIKRCREIGIDLQVLSYSRHRDDLKHVMERWIGLPEGSLENPTQTVVNRSLSIGELILQQEFNRHLGRTSSSLISDPLCNQLPNIKSDYPAIHKRELAPFLDRMKEMAKAVNEQLAPEEGSVAQISLRPSFPFPWTESSDALSLRCSEGCEAVQDCGPDL